MDVVGVLTLSVLTALGGGIVRDLLLGSTPPAALTDPVTLLTPVAVGLVVSVVHPAVERLRRWVDVADAFGLGLFATTGATIALDTGAPAVTAVVTGLVTAVGGGVIRDVLADGVPHVLRHEVYYALPALAGAVLVVTGHELGLPAEPVTAGAAAVVTAVRLAAMLRRWRAPLPFRAAAAGPSTRS
jgi:uncharacterized membrane protein YeiH